MDEFLDCFTTQFTAHELDAIHSPAGPVTILPAFSPATRPKVATPRACRFVAVVWAWSLSPDNAMVPACTASDPRLHMFFWHWACKEAYVKVRRPRLL